MEQKIIMHHKHFGSILLYYFKMYVTTIKIIGGHLNPHNGTYHLSQSMRHLKASLY